MRGATHFSVGFLLGYLVWLLVCWRVRDGRVRLLAAFLPWVLGCLAALPYALFLLGLVPGHLLGHTGWNLFLLYPLLASSAWAQQWLTDFHLNLLIMTVAYAHLVWRSIAEVRAAREGLAHAQ